MHVVFMYEINLLHTMRKFKHKMALIIVVIVVENTTPRKTSNGDTHFYSARCIFNKVVTFYTHLYYLSTLRGAFTHLGRTPLHQTI